MGKMRGVTSGSHQLSQGIARIAEAAGDLQQRILDDFLQYLFRGICSEAFDTGGSQTVLKELQNLLVILLRMGTFMAGKDKLVGPMIELEPSFFEYLLERLAKLFSGDVVLVSRKVVYLAFARYTLGGYADESFDCFLAYRPNIWNRELIESLIDVLYGL
jgi:hypothetical protein